MFNADNWNKVLNVGHLDGQWTMVNDKGQLARSQEWEASNE